MLDSDDAVEPMYNLARMFTVVIAEKDGAERRVTFTESEVTIGRVPGNDVVLPKGNVSKRHSRIVLKDNRFIVVDLKSTNGTYVNGRKITSPLVVKEGDKIYVGDYVLTLEGANALDAPRAPSLLSSDLKPGATLAGRNTIAESEPVSDELPLVLRGVSHSSMPATSVARPSELPVPEPQSAELEEEPILAAESELEVFEGRVERSTKAESDGALPLPPPPPPIELRERLAGRSTVNEYAGDQLGPLDAVLADPAVFHVVVERFDRVRADRGAGLAVERVSFASPEALGKLARGIAAQAGLPNSVASYDISLPSGLQVVAVLPAAASNGPVLSLRRRPSHLQQLTEMERRHLLTSQVSGRITEALQHKRHVWIVGPSGSELAAFASGALATCLGNERVALFERAPELAIGDRSAICLKLGTVPTAELLERVRSFRPDRLVVHGVREAELSVLLDAFAHRPDGNIATYEARSAKDALVAFDRALGADLALRAVSLLVEVRRVDGTTKVIGAYDVELDGAGDLALKQH
ncbi:MAG TPA: FHA domain-containing protein [Polyangiales bacterium]|nr:FHA domain-containing protein [Polyangiales bacterium]